MKQIQKFFKLFWDSKIEYWTLFKTMSQWEALKLKENAYFVAGVSNPNKRSSNETIEKKNYFYIDFDIRKNIKEKEDRICSDQELEKRLNVIIEKLQHNDFVSKWFNDYSTIVFTGNWYHFYYVWDFIDIDIKKYSHGINKILKEFDKLIDDEILFTDIACKNIARLSRLPWTINYSRKTKYWLELKRVEILELDYINCKLVSLINKIGENEIKRIGEETTKAESDIYKKSNNDIFEEIVKIPLADIVCGDFGLEVSENGINFKWTDKSCYQWMHLWIGKNSGDQILINDWSHFLSQFGMTKKVYNTFLYIKDKNKLSPRDTFIRFEDNYPQIKQIAEQQREEFKNKNSPNKEKQWIQILQKQYSKKWFVYPAKVFDYFDCVMSGELVTVVAESNSGKTTFAMDIIEANSRIEKKWFYINLEFAIETVWQWKWLYVNGKSKRTLTDLDPLTDFEKKEMNSYVARKLKQFDYYNNPKGILLEELIKLIIKKNKEWYELFVLDTFSRIKGNLENEGARTSQNKSMEMLQELVQKIGIVLINLHHTNKKGIFEWSQKIMDLSNVFIQIKKEIDGDGIEYREFTISKDKYISKKTLDVYYVNKMYSNIPPKPDNPDRFYN